MEKIEIRIAGSGGQGVILATIILAEAAIIAGKKAAQSQSYGPEARGGLCKAEVIISEQNIWYTKVKRPSLLLALTQESLERYALDVADGGTVIADSGLSVSDTIRSKYRVLSMPILRSAKERTGKSLTANIVAVAAINRVLELVGPEELKEAVLFHVPKGTEEINITALRAGVEIAETAIASEQN